MTRFLTLPKEFAARVRQTVMRPDTAESPPLEPLSRRADRAELRPPRPPAAQEIPPLPVVAGPRRPRAPAGPVPDPRAGHPGAPPPRDASAGSSREPPRDPPRDPPQSMARGAPTPALDIYNAHFGLTALPFALTPDPDFLFWSPAHRRAYAMLEYGVMTHAPITLITGEVGAGKTTLLQHLLRSLGPDVTVGLISNPGGSRTDLLRWVLMALHQQPRPEDSHVDLFARFQACVLDEYAMGRRVILIFDEAQNLDRAALEELRMFTNINTGRDVLLQLVLVGQPELRQTVARRDMRQFAQRVAALFALPAMDLPTAQDYILHRLKVAGRTRRLFEADAVAMIHRLTGGVPRLINRLCDLSLVYAFTAGRRMVDAETVHEVLEDGAFLAMDPDAEGPDHDL